MSETNAAERAARAQMQEEHRAIMQATMQAQRAGKLPRPASSRKSDALTAIVVVITVIGVLVLALKYGG